MKKVTLIATILIATIPAILGYQNYTKARVEISSRMESDPSFGGDLDIETVTTKHGFSLEWHQEPTLVDFYISGLKQIGYQGY